jgi:hypothetical protein
MLKEEVYKACLNLVKQKIAGIEAAFKMAQEGGHNESKSSAGDKHETSRALMHLEQEKLGLQLKEMNDQLQKLEQIDIIKKSHTIGTGSLVETDKGIFFIGVGLGKIPLSFVAFAISNASPLGIKFAGRKENDSVEVNGVPYHIKKIQ